MTNQIYVLFMDSNLLEGDESNFIFLAPPTCYDVATTVTNSWTCRNCFNLFVSIDMTNIISQAEWDRQIYITFEGQPELIKFAGPVTAIDPQFGSTNVYKVSFRDGHEFGDGKITFNAEFSGSESKVNSAWACPTTGKLTLIAFMSHN